MEKEREIKFVFVIPAYNPAPKLVEIVGELLKRQKWVVVINDGTDTVSGKQVISELKSRWSENRRFPLLEHSENKGKGAALKTGFKYILEKFPPVKGVVTLDADGQHLIEDCLRVESFLEKLLFAKKLEAEKVLVLGVRDFRNNVPWKSYLGNEISKFLYWIFLGKFLSDTQTGLRGISRNLLEEFIQLKSQRFDFETEELIMAIEEKCIIEEMSIETVYIDDNKRSSFQPFLDSFRIYWVVLKYSLTSFLTFLLDFTVFSLLSFFGQGLYVANLIARFFGLTFQFFVSRNWVFKSKVKYRMYFFFVVYVFLTGLLSAYLQGKAIYYFHWSKYLSKIIVEFLIFWWNFFFLRKFVF